MGLCPRGDLNPETGEISLIMDLNSNTGEESPDWGVHAIYRTPDGRAATGFLHADVAFTGRRSCASAHSPWRRVSREAR
jgi:hypothetical protein